jgi:hypothetical protein
MIALPVSDLGAFAFRLANAAEVNGWLALIIDEEQRETAHKLAGEIAALTDESPPVVSAPDAVAMELAAREHPADVLLLELTQAFGEQAWREADAQRSRLYRQGSTALIMTIVDLARMESLAPNFASWLAGNVWKLHQVPSPIDARMRERRLEALRQWAGLSDEEVVAKAEQRTLPGDPPYAEWLLLLGREDLLVR